MSDEPAVDPAEVKERLDELQHDIDEVRRRLDDPLDDGTRSFVDEGEAGGGEGGDGEESAPTGSP